MAVASFSVVLNHTADKEREGYGHQEGNQLNGDRPVEFTAQIAPAESKNNYVKPFH
jgi:hypothetical protein